MNFRRLLSSVPSATIDECPPVELPTADCRSSTHFGKGNLVLVQDRRKSFDFISGRLPDLESAGPRCCQSVRDTEFHVTSSRVGQPRGHPQGVPLRWDGRAEGNVNSASSQHCPWTIGNSMKPKGDSTQIAIKKLRNCYLILFLLLFASLSVAGQLRAAPALLGATATRRRRAQQFLFNNAACRWPAPGRDLRSGLMG